MHTGRQPKLYHCGIRENVSRNTPANANEHRAGFKKAIREFDENKVVEIVLDEYYRSLDRLRYKQV